MAEQENNQEDEQPQLPIVLMPETDEQRREHSFLIKARDRFYTRVPKYNRPKTDCWGLWKEQWTTACQSSIHPDRDRDGSRLSIKEALWGEAAIQGQHVTRASCNLSADEMIAELDKIFMPKQESSLARQEFHDNKQHPDEPALAYFDKGWPGGSVQHNCEKGPDKRSTHNQNI